FWEERGAFTGEISAAMLISVGARWVICGHSERRRLLGESDHIVNAKLRRALENGLRVILAVGETEHERQDGRTEEVLASQLQGSLVGVGAEEFERLVIAYEPVWAIGTGLTASPEQAQSAHAFVRVCLSESHGS